MKLMTVGGAASLSLLYTKLFYIAKADSSIDLLERTLVITRMVEDLDNIKLTIEERLTAAVFSAFMSRKTNEVIPDPRYKIKTVKALTADWYTSVTSSNILWIKEELRRDPAVRDVDMTADVNSWGDGDRQHVQVRAVHLKHGTRR